MQQVGNNSSYCRCAGTGHTWQYTTGTDTNKCSPLVSANKRDISFTFQTQWNIFQVSLSKHNEISFKFHFSNTMKYLSSWTIIDSIMTTDAASLFLPGTWTFLHFTGNRRFVRLMKFSWSGLSCFPITDIFGHKQNNSFRVWSVEIAVISLQ